nr:bifunctional hydroxymethylpyrimidine kinase/phosphomethylpyrimidine kinase [Acidaminobacter sp. JC074]
MKSVLTIAGSDCSGGAGIQADLKTMTVHDVYGMSCITALTAQNTTGVYGVVEISPDFIEQQLDTIFKDIYPDAIKIGMVANSEIISVIVKKLKEYNARNIVVDPVMVATSGDPLISNEAMDALIQELLPLGSVITPNIPEAEKLSGMIIDSEEKMIEAAKIISKNLNGSLLIKGGHFGQKANDLLYTKGQCYWYSSERYINKNTHGTGCTLSSAIASNLAKNFSVEESIKKSKDYISGAIKADLNIGKGRGPLNHMY